MNGQTKRTGCLGMGLRLIGGALVLLVLLGVGCSIYEVRAETAVSEQYPAPGQLVEVNGRTMHIHCEGESSPTIVLDAGQGGWSSDWETLMPQLSKNNRVCAYDRAGYGWSEPVSEGHSPQDAADDLVSLLAAAKIEPPYVMVSFSHSGLAARLFAAQNADQITGMVLIDPATEFDNEIMSAELVKQQQATFGMLKGFSMMARVGLLRMMGTQNMAGSAPFIGTNPANPDVYYTFISDPQWWETSSQEFASHLDDDHLAMVRDNGNVPNIPLVIIGSDVLDTSGNSALDGLQAARHEVLSNLAAQSSQGEFIVADGSTHNVTHDRPDIVIAAIKSITNQIEND